MKKAFAAKWVDPTVEWDVRQSNSEFKEEFTKADKSEWPIKHLIGYINGTTKQNQSFEDLWVEFQPVLNKTNQNLKIKRYLQNPEDQKLSPLPTGAPQVISSDYCIVLFAVLGQAEKGGSQFGTVSTGKSQSTTTMNLNDFFSSTQFQIPCII